MSKEYIPLATLAVKALKLTSQEEENLQILCV